ncbi:MAG: methionyl-tRNA formyltransferase [Gaiellales bacterium]|nr:methionyl-tRNA formyltransferase [Gaiellales bacterium]
MRLAFAGSPQFGAWVLGDLTAAGRSPLLVITPPDRPQGRGRQPAPCPVAVLADALGIPVLRTPDINQEAVAAVLEEGKIDVLLVAAFGQLLKPPLLEALSCLNLHASLLPRHRGAAPIHWALRNGESETGVCVMRMEEALDAGPVAAVTRISISPRDDAGSLGRALALLGALAADQVLTAMADGTVEWRQQSEGWTYAPKVGPNDRLLRPELGAVAAHNLVRSLSPDTGSEVGCGGLRLKVWRTWPWEAEADGLPAAGREVAGRPGHWGFDKNRLFLGCAQGALEVFRIQPAGKPVMSAAEFVRGYGRRLQTSPAP